MINIIKGCKLFFNNAPILQSFKNQPVFNAEENQFICKMLTDLENDKVITKTVHDIEGVTHSIFLVEKGSSQTHDKKFRLILNMKDLNKQNITKEKFKMESLNSCILLMDQNCFMASLDLKDAYHSIPIWGPHQKFLQFIFNKQCYKYLVLPQGYKDSPRIFTRILKPVLGFLRTNGICCSIYIDDIYIQGQDLQECVSNVQFAKQLLLSLGFEISKKSTFTPTQKLFHLGFVLDSVKMVVSLDTKKQFKIQDMSQKLINEKTFTIRFLSKFIGSIVACFPAVRYGPLFYRELELCKILALKKNRFDFDAFMNLNSAAIEEIKFWMYEGIFSFKPVYERDVDFIIQTDSSDFAWGAVFEDKETQGFWNEYERLLHINCKELLAVNLGVKAFASELNNVHIQVQVDNTTAVCYINKMGGTHSVKCNDITKDLLLWCKNKNIWLSATHIAGKDNCKADKCSRNINIEAEMSLNVDIFEELCSIYGRPDLDVFASRINHKLSKYISRFADSGAFAIDAFKHVWKGFIYIFPPFILINRILSKIKRDKQKKVLIVN